MAYLAGYKDSEEAFLAFFGKRMYGIYFAQQCRYTRYKSPAFLAINYSRGIQRFVMLTVVYQPFPNVREHIFNQPVVRYGHYVSSKKTG